MRLHNIVYMSIKIPNSMAPKKVTKKTQEKSETAITGPITRDKSGNICIQINAKPGAKNNNITDVSSDGIGVQINAPPSDGEANAELIKYLSKILGLRKSDLLLDRGSRSRNKIIVVSGTKENVESLTEKFRKEIEENM